MLFADAASVAPAPVPQAGAPKGVSVKPESAGATIWDGASLGLGLSTDYLMQRTGDRYDNWPLSYQLSWDQHIRSIWSGGISLRSGAWEALPGRGAGDRFPLLISSRVHAGVPLWRWLGSTPVARIVQPFMTGALGALVFLKERAPASGLAKEPRPEAFAGAGLGVRVSLAGPLRLRLAVDVWRGFETYNHTAMGCSAELQFGESGLPYE